MRWTELSNHGSTTYASDPERFLIHQEQRGFFNYWLTDLASNHPPNPPSGYPTLDKAKAYAEWLVEHGRLG